MDAFLRDSDNFFFHGDNDLQQEIQHDILSLMLQPKRSLLYSRSLNAAGIDQYENRPNTRIINVLLPYDVVTAISKRNNVVGNGQNNTKERRVAVSQNFVRINNNGNNLDVTILYIPLVDINSKVQVNNRVGVIGGV